ncbi:flavin reductase [Candidatus Woesearchaeota archaeon]|nr:flavin reductase [Candidatus Woesearchaeota archaeon]
MDLPWGSEGSRKFVTNVGLITSNGSVGDNIMSAEWTHHVSYRPGLIAVCISNSNDASLVNIKESKEFGVNLAGVDQKIISSTSGQNSGSEVDKIKVLKELGFEFYKAKNINVLMVKGVVLNVECKLIKTIELGSHTMLVGEVVDLKVNNEKEPLIYHGGSYYKLGDKLDKPKQEDLDNINKLIEKYKK